MHLKTQFTCGRHFKKLAVALLSSLFLPMALHAADVPARSVSLAWNPNPESNVAGYKVRFGTARGVYSQVIDAGRETSAALPQMILGSTYYMAVSAYNMAGEEGPASAEFVVTPALPQPVESTTFSLTGGSQGELRWSYPSSSAASAEGFAIYSSENLSDWSVAGTALPAAGAAGGSTYTFPIPLIPGKSRMFFRVNAINPFGESP